MEGDGSAVRPVFMLDLTPALRLYAAFRRARLSRLNAAKTQEQQLRRLIRAANNTRFGREHGFEAIRSVADFQARVPLRRYEDFWEDYWRATFPHIGDQTWPGEMPYFALTSGTSSGRTKYIPVSRAMLRSNLRASLDTMTHHLSHAPHSRVLGGPNLMLSGSSDLKPLAPGILAGDLSGIQAREVPAWARPYYFPRGELAHLEDWEEKVRRISRLSLEMDLRSVSGTISWLLLFFEQVGALKPESAGRLAALYPKLELLAYGGVNFEPYRRQVMRLIEGSSIDLREVYPASEGFIAAADRGPGEGLRIVLDHGLFFEFVPSEELEAERPRRFWIGDAQCGVDYALVISNCAGAWAYVLGDTVRLVDRDPPRLVVTGRTSYFLSAFGEHLTGEEIERAVTEAEQAIEAEITDFSVGAVLTEGAPGYHLFLVEFRGEPPAEAQGNRFLEVLDATLSDLNDDYRSHRAGGFGMAAPRLEILPRGGFARWMRARGKEGGQHKVPRVINDFELLTSLRAMAGER